MDANADAAGGAGIGLQARNLSHSYPGMPPVVQVDHLHIAPGETVALTGPSGSGKTTLLYLLTGIEPVRSGSVAWGGTDLAQLPEKDRDCWRRQHVGFVFQDFHLVPGLSIADNVMIGCYFVAVGPDAVDRERCRGLLERFGVPLAGRSVTDLSRGEQQRVAIARALLRSPPLLVADEPTASLDAEAGRAVIEALTAAARETGATLLTVTHDPALIAAVGTVHTLERGRVARRS